MKIADVYLLDFDAEIENARRYFAVIPEDKADWKPHEKSRTLGQLAKHVATLPHFGSLFFKTDGADVTKLGPPPLIFTSRADLFQTLEQSSNELRALLAAAGDELLMKEWAFTLGDAVLAAGPRAAMYRTMFLHHFIHHRAQLGVYLRMLNVPIPGIYGPSADEAQTPAMR